MRSDELKKLSSPASVAVIGASDPETSWFGGRTFRNIVRGGGARTVFAVNGRRAGTELLGLPVYESVADLPEPPELSVVLTPDATVPDVLRDIARRGGRHVLLCTAFRGKDHTRFTAYETEIARLGNELGLSIVGGNSAGILNGNSGLNASFLSSAENGVPGGRLAFLAQSGASIGYLLARFAGRPVGYSHLISTGNENVLSLPAILSAVIEDDSTDAIGMFLEGVGDGRGLRRAFLRAAELGKPVAVLKVGRTDIGRQAAQSHTGRMTGDDAVFRAVAGDAGVIVAESYGDLYDHVYRLARVSRTRMSAGRRAAVITPSGGAAIVAADALRERGWELPEPSPATASALRADGAYQPANPLDATGAFQNTSLIPALTRTFAGSGEFDEIFLLYGAGGDPGKRIAAELATVASNLPIPVSAGYIAPPSGVREDMERAGVVFFEDHLAPIATASAHRSAVVAHAGDLAGLVRRIDDHAGTHPVGTDQHPVTATEVFALLDGAGLTSASHTCQPPDADFAEVETAARSVGFPCVLKVESRQLLHKSDTGGVVLGVGPDNLAAAWERVVAAVPATDAGARILVQHMASGVEVLVGARQDPNFGWVIALGSGGTHTELLNDVRLIPVPTTEEAVRQALRGHRRLSTLLRGFRGDEGGDAEALVGLVVSFADWLVGDGADFVEVDLNPVLVSNSGAVVVDARGIRRGA